MPFKIKWPLCDCGRRHNPDLTAVDHYGRNRELHIERSRKYRKSRRKKSPVWQHEHLTAALTKRKQR
jgi:hypothetical protein